MADPRTTEDALNLLCGDLLGQGIHRKVWTCRIRDDLVVKVEDEGTEWRYFPNVREMNFWCENEHHAPVAKWLAPCEYMSPDGRVMLQRRAIPLPHDYVMPDKMPTFLTDFKRENYGLIDGKLVCVDYAMTIPSTNTRLKKVQW